MTNEPEAAGRIVVGVDGSDNARRALSWALDEARQRGIGCLLIHSFDFGIAAASPLAPIAFEQLREAAHLVLDEELAWAKRSGVSVEGRVEVGSRAHALIEASARRRAVSRG